MPRPCRNNWGRHSLGASVFRRRQPFRYRGMKGRDMKGRELALGGDRLGQVQRRGGAHPQHNLLITRLFGCRELAVLRQCAGESLPRTEGRIMAKRKKQSKVQSRAKLRRANSAKRSKARKVAKTAKRLVVKAKPKPAPVKKAARKVKPPAAPAIETATV